MKINKIVGTVTKKPMNAGNAKIPHNLSSSEIVASQIFDSIILAEGRLSVDKKIMRHKTKYKSLL